MKSILIVFSAVTFLILASPASAHHRVASSDQGYLVFWMGIPPKSGPALDAAAHQADFWRHAFIS